jgi:hypothetical protein
MWRVRSHNGPKAPLNVNGLLVTTSQGSVDTSDLSDRRITSKEIGPFGEAFYQVTIEMPRYCVVPTCTGPLMRSKHAALEHASGAMMQALVEAGELDQGLRPRLAKVLMVCTPAAASFLLPFVVPLTVQVACKQKRNDVFQQSIGVSWICGLQYAEGRP